MTRIEVTTLAEDDRLLDALGRGETPNGDDPVAALLGDWRAALPETCPVEDRPGRPARRPSRRRGRLVAAAAAVALVAAGGGVTVAAEHAEPDSPLWPVTRLLYRDLADSRAARQAADEAVAVAVAAIEDGRYDHATELLDRATALVEQVDEPATEHRLRSRIATVRAQLTSATGGITEGSVTEGTVEAPAPPTAGDPPTVLPPTPAPASPAATTASGNETGGNSGGDNSGDNSGGNRTDRPGNGRPTDLPVLPSVPAPNVPDPGTGS